MAFYELPKEERALLVTRIHGEIASELNGHAQGSVLRYFNDTDTYIRKSAYLAVGRIYQSQPELRQAIIKLLDRLMEHNAFNVRQTAINAAGEIGKSDFESVQHLFDIGLFDSHHAPRNAVVGSIKKMGELNPGPVLAWAANYLRHPDKEIRREICHGIELRGRKHPEDILPLLKELQNDQTARVRNTLVHVIGQIAYKPGCLRTVVKDLKSWDNEELVAKALAEIVDVHHRYRAFAAMSVDEARQYIAAHFPGH